MPRIEMVEVALWLTSGTIGFRSAGSLRLMLWFRGFAGPVGAATNVFVVSRDRQDRMRTHQWEPDLGAVARIAGAARAAGFERGVPDVEGSIDTSDGWTRLRCEVNLGLDEQTQRLDVGLYETGLEGPDAETVRDFFATVLAEARVQDTRVWHLLTRREPVAI